MYNKKNTGNFLKKYPGVKIGIIALILFLVVGVSSAFAIEKQVIVDVDGKEYTANGKLLESLEEVLIANDLPVSNEYEYSIGLNTLFKDVINVDIKKKRAIKIVEEGKPKTYFSNVQTVGELLEENDIVLDEDDRVEPGLETVITSALKQVKVIRVSMVDSTNKKVIPMTAIVKENPDLPVGTRTVIQVGENGSSIVKERVCYEDGFEKSRVFISEEMLTPVIEEVIEVGPLTTVFMPKTVKVTSTTGNVNVESDNEEQNDNDDTGFTGRMIVSATAYAPTGNATASGVMPQAGHTLAAWGDVPLGTRVYIPALGGVYVVEDRGGAVVTGIIDIYMNTEEECVAWGRQNIEIYFLD